VLNNTACNPARFALSTNSTNASFTGKVPLSLASGQTAGPALIASAGNASTTGFFQVGTSNIVASILEIMPIATAANDVTGSFRVWGWRDVLIAGVPYLWPKLLAEYDFIAGNIAAGYAASTFLADTITLADGDSTGLISSPGDDLPAWLNIDLRGHKYWQFDPAINSGTATAINALWSLIS
jgi:hypothetical protein